MSRRDFLKGVGGTVMFGVLASACAPQAAPTSAPQTGTQGGGAAQAGAAQPGGPVEWRFATWENYQNDPGYLKSLEKFSQDNNVKINPEVIPWTGFVQKMLTLAAANSLPDIFRVNGSHVAPYGYRDVLYDLTPYIQRDNFNMEMYYPRIRRIYQYPVGKQIALPEDNANYAAAYINTKLFQEAGVDVPKAGWTWDDVTTLAEKLTKKQGSRTTQYGVFIETSGYPSPVIISLGGQMSDDNYNPKKATFDTPEHADAFNYLLDLIYKRGVHPSPQAGQELGGGSSAFATGKVAMLVGEGLWANNEFTEAKDLKWTLVPAPHRAGKDPRHAIAGAGFGMPRMMKTADLGWKFLKFFVGPEGWQIRLDARRKDYIWPSAIKEFSAKEAQSKASLFPALPDVIKATEVAVPWWMLHPNLEEMWATVLTPVSDQILRQEKTVEAGLGEMQAKAQKLVDNLPAKS
jgi:multiple sugar transport system substrate-binding protein